MRTTLTPMLTVSDSATAIEFYKRAFGANEGQRLVTPTGQVVAQLSIDGNGFFVVDEDPAAFNVSPLTLGGTTVRMSLVVADPDALYERAVAAGARAIFPVGDRPYGMRQGRIADPSGHHWLIGRPLVPTKS